ncbi:MAG TPA: DNA methyltransferase [Candidatus Andersenbacteria bacterium]|nr:DNA methyltransferase [Candidatus Andersenbacteria bacterium]
MKYTFFLGTNPLLSVSEIIAYLNRTATDYTVSRITRSYIRIETNMLPEDIGDQLGGTIRIATDVAGWNHMPDAEKIIAALSALPPKWVMGLSILSGSVSVKKFAISIKKAAKAQGSKLSFIEPKGSSLNAAQVLFNKLTENPNMDLSILRIGENYMLLKTIHIQNIAQYELRDTSRPARDARVGLLPPKLAQIMINLTMPQKNTTIYDPFCGMGTILQEAWIMGFQAIGSDASERMISASQENLAWIAQHFPVSPDIRPETFLHDVTQQFPEYLIEKKLTIITEPFLGTPLTHPLSSPEIEIFHNKIIELYRFFFQNIRKVLAPGARVLVLLPCPKGQDGFTPLPRTFIDEIASIGYRKVQLAEQEITSYFQQASDPVLYARPDALVAREVTLWEAI